ncbi:hypothetical protein PWT90_02205 [Aphanocladium album]|nr:hypothetical protein PWT90_02205 [Aphanocladium album]
MAKSSIERELGNEGLASDYELKDNEPHVSPELEYDDEGGLLVFNGKIQTEKGETQNVQLISHFYTKNQPSLFGMLMRFWASHIQCFIGGWCAGHTHYMSAMKRKMFIWTLKNQNPESVGKAMLKYRARGFTAAYENQPHWRDLFDEHSYFVDFSDKVMNVAPRPNWWCDKEYSLTLYNMTSDEIYHGEEAANANDDDEARLVNRRANLVSIKWQNASGRTIYSDSTLAALRCFGWAW